MQLDSPRNTPKQAWKEFNPPRIPGHNTVNPFSNNSLLPNDLFLLLLFFCVLRVSRRSKELFRLGALSKSRPLA